MMENNNVSLLWPNEHYKEKVELYNRLSERACSDIGLNGIIKEMSIEASYEKYISSVMGSEVSSCYKNEASVLFPAFGTPKKQKYGY